LKKVNFSFGLTINLHTSNKTKKWSWWLIYHLRKTEVVLQKGNASMLGGSFHTFCFFLSGLEPS